MQIQFHTSAASGQINGQSDQWEETNERRTSNVQHRTSNNVFYLF